MPNKFMKASSKILVLEGLLMRVGVSNYNVKLMIGNVKWKKYHQLFYIFNLTYPVL